MSKNQEIVDYIRGEGFKRVSASAHLVIYERDLTDLGLSRILVVALPRDIKPHIQVTSISGEIVAGALFTSKRELYQYLLAIFFGVR